jgi:catechol 2,3-dioxygenase-like lactoylglutathione lyase family enzyme
MIKTQGLVHFTIPVTDTARAKDFYCRVLGSGGDCLILAKTEKPISTAGEVDIHHSFLVAHEDYAPALAELKSNGVKFLWEEDRRDGVVDGPRAYFEDPDGNVLEIIDLTRYAGAAD